MRWKTIWMLWMNFCFHKLISSFFVRFTRQFCSNACENIADFSAFDIMRFDAVLCVRLFFSSLNTVSRTQHVIKLNIVRRLRMADILSVTIHVFPAFGEIQPFFACSSRQIWTVFNKSETEINGNFKLLFEKSLRVCWIFISFQLFYVFHKIRVKKENSIRQFQML